MIDIIIVNYNASTYLTDCVQAALNSTIAVNIVVADNGSTDNSLSLLRNTITDERLRIIENKANLGFARANNVALAFARSATILFLNPDCIIQPDTLEQLDRYLQQRSDVGMVGCLIQNPDGSEQAGCRRNIPTPWTAFVRAFGLKKLAKIAPGFFKPAIFNDFVTSDQPLPLNPVEVDAISGAFMLVKRETLNQVGAWDESYFLHCEDIDWCMRIQQAGIRILFVPETKIMHIKGGCSQSRPLFVQWHMHKGMVRFYQKFFTDRYSPLLMYAVFTGIWLRFGMLVVKGLLTAGVSDIRRRLFKRERMACMKRQ